MSFRKLGYVIIGFGLFGALLSLLVDYLGFGKPGIQAAQLLGIQVGIVTALIGTGLVLSKRQEKLDIFIMGRGLSYRILNWPYIVWLMIGFLIIYMILFVQPAFWNPEHRIHYFNRYIPELAPIGADLTWNTTNISSWLSGQSLDTGGIHYYPPLHAVVFAPILLLNYPANYYFITAVTLASIAIFSLILPALINRRTSISVTIFFLLTVIFSYGMQFELERGQFNVIAFMLCLLAVYLYHYHESFRHLAYFLFSVSIQIKIYPAIIIFMFVKDWRDWKNNLMRFLGLGLFNIALLFVLGYSVFIDFLKAISSLMNTTYVLPYNHSLKAFIYEVTNSGLGFLHPNTVSWLKENSSLIGILFFAYYFLCLFAVLAKAYINKERGINFDLLMICTIGAMILPSVSYDYKLPLLAPPLAMTLSQRPALSSGLRKIPAILSVVAISSAYSVSLFPFVNRPGLLANSLPMILVILTAITLLNFLDGGSRAGPISSEKIDQAEESFT